MKELKIKCPCCKNHIQLILSDSGTGDVKIASVFLIEENDDSNTIQTRQEDLEKELFDKQNILLG